MTALKRLRCALIERRLDLIGAQIALEVREKGYGQGFAGRERLYMRHHALQARLDGLKR